MKISNYKDIVFKIGTNKTENSVLHNLANIENQDYIWFHLNSFSSGFVIMYETIDNLKQVHNFSIDEINDILLYGAKLCLENTKYRNLRDIYVVYCPIKKLKTTTIEGCVIVSGKKNLIKI
tara:strand:+ start:49 stop:411 length:363 start_codon:yes stop_codon:yes gene_type:complete